VTLKNPATADRSFSTAVVAGVLPVRCASRMEQGNGSRTWCRTPGLGLSTTAYEIVTRRFGSH
jgi:hypothetical protein